MLYGIIWVCTVGKLHFWLLPNLTAECGFFESFVPLYEYTLVKSTDDTEDDEKKKSPQSPTTSDKEDRSVSDANPDPPTADAAKPGIEDIVTSSGVCDVTEASGGMELKERDSLLELSGDTGVEELNNSVVGDEKNSSPQPPTTQGAGTEGGDTESEEGSLGSNDGEAWVKVHSEDASEEMEEAKNETEIKCWTLRGYFLSWIFDGGLGDFWVTFF